MNRITIISNFTSNTFKLYFLTIISFLFAAIGDVSAACPTLSSSLKPSICSATIFNYTATSLTAGATFTWKRNAVSGISQSTTSGTGSIVSETLTNTTTSPIYVTYVFNVTANGCTNPQNVVVTVKPKPKLNSGLTPPAICSGTTFSYKAGSTISGSTFTWTRAAVTNISTPSPSSGGPDVSNVLTNSSNAQIEVTYLYKTSFNGCSSAQNVVVSVKPIPVVTVSSSVQASICVGKSTTLTAAGASTYMWSPSTYLGSTTGASVISTPLKAINYTVEGTLNACKGYATIGLLVNPNCKSLQETDMAMVDKMVLPAEGTIFPNPTSGIINIYPIVGNDLTIISITDALGKTILETKTIDNASVVEVDLSTQPEGVYFVRLANGSNTLNKKIIKQ